MKKILIAFIALVSYFLSGCATARPPNPPFSMPFAVHKAGEIISTDLRISIKRYYEFYLCIYYYGTSQEEGLDLQRVRKLVGRPGGVGSGVDIPVMLRITETDESGQTVIIEEQIYTNGHVAHGFVGFNGAVGGHYDRKIKNVKLRRGNYHVLIKTLKDTPEFTGTPVEVVIGGWRKY